MEKAIFYQGTQAELLKEIQNCVATVIKKELKSLSVNEDHSDEFIGMDEVSKILKVSKPTIYKHLEKGFYKKHNVGRKVLFSRSEILGFIRGESKGGENGI